MKGWKRRGAGGADHAPSSACEMNHGWSASSSWTDRVERAQQTRGATRKPSTSPLLTTGRTVCWASRSVRESEQMPSGSHAPSQCHIRVSLCLRSRGQSSANRAKIASIPRRLPPTTARAPRSTASCRPCGAGRAACCRCARPSRRAADDWASANRGTAAAHRSHRRRGAE